MNNYGKKRKICKLWKLFVVNYLECDQWFISEWNKSIFHFLVINIVLHVEVLICLSVCLCHVQLMLCSCLIARNLLSGSKTCMEISSYMHDGGMSMPHRSIISAGSIMDDKGKFDTECTVRLQASMFPSFTLHSHVLLSWVFFCYFLLGVWGETFWRQKIKFSIFYYVRKGLTRWYNT